MIDDVDIPSEEDPPPVVTVGWYRKRVRRIDLLAAEDEVDLAQRIEVGLYADELLNVAAERGETLPASVGGDLRWLVRDVVDQAGGHTRYRGQGAERAAPFHVVEDVIRLNRLRDEYEQFGGREATDSEIAVAAELDVDKVRMLDSWSLPWKALTPWSIRTSTH